MVVRRTNAGLLLLLHFDRWIPSFLVSRFAFLEGGCFSIALYCTETEVSLLNISSFRSIRVSLSIRSKRGQSCESFELFFSIWNPVVSSVKVCALEGGCVSIALCWAETEWQCFLVEYLSFEWAPAFDQRSPQTWCSSPFWSANSVVFSVKVCISEGGWSSFGLYCAQKLGFPCWIYLSFRRPRHSIKVGSPFEIFLSISFLNSVVFSVKVCILEGWFVNIALYCTQPEVSLLNISRFLESEP